MFKKILVPTDGSSQSQRAVQAAVEFAAATGASLVGLSVAQQYPYMLLPEAGSVVDLGEFEQAEEQAARKHVQDLAAAAQAAGVACETVTLRAVHPHEEILALAKDRQCDLVWMGSHGRKGLDRLILGSETQRVLAHANLPVLVYR